MRQTIAALPIKLFMKLVWYWQSWQCPSGAPFHYAVCHTTCCSHGIRHGSSCVLHATSFITSFVPLHYTTFVARPFAARHGTLSWAQRKGTSDAHTFSQATLQYSLGSIPLHYVLHSFRSHSVHPLPIILLALRTTVCVTGLHWHTPSLMHWPPHKALKCMSRSSPSLCVHRSLRSLYCPPQPVVLAATSIRSSFQWLLTARYAAMLQPLLLPGAADASFCRRRFYLFCQRTGEYKWAMKKYKVEWIDTFKRIEKKGSKLGGYHKPWLMAAKKFRHKHKAYSTKPSFIALLLCSQPRRLM